MQTQDNTKTCIEEETEELNEKPLRNPPSRNRSCKVVIYN